MKKNAKYVVMAIVCFAVTLFELVDFLITHNLYNPDSIAVQIWNHPTPYVNPYLQPFLFVLAFAGTIYWGGKTLHKVILGL